MAKERSQRLQDESGYCEPEQELVWSASQLRNYSYSYKGHPSGTKRTAESRFPRFHYSSPTLGCAAKGVKFSLRSRRAASSWPSMRATRSRTSPTSLIPFIIKPAIIICIMPMNNRQPVCPVFFAINSFPMPSDAPVGPWPVPRNHKVIDVGAAIEEPRLEHIGPAFNIKCKFFFNKSLRGWPELAQGQRHIHQKISVGHFLFPAE